MSRPFALFVLLHLPIRLVRSSRHAALMIAAAALVLMSYPAYASFDGTGNAADAVLGQLDFTKNAVNFVDASGLSVGTEAGVVVDSSGGLWVADTSNNRVLGWPNAASFSNGAPATIVIGQPDFNSSYANNTGGLPGAAPTAATLWGPSALAIDPASGNLWVADSQNNRVLVFEPPFVSGMNASQVYGQSGSFTTNGGCTHVGTTTAGALCLPQGIAIDGAENVFLVDTNDHRVLEFDSAASNFNQTANLVIGQPDFTHKICNNSGNNLTGQVPSAQSLCVPESVAVDAQEDVYVVDHGNNRILEYNNPVATHAIQPNANVVFGQAGIFTTNYCDANTVPPTVNPTTLCGPHAATVDASGNLWVTDSTNSRALEYLAPTAVPNPACVPAADGSGCAGDTAADLVLGQSDFTHRSPNDTSTPNVLGPNTLATPEGITTRPNGGGTDVYVVDNATLNSKKQILAIAQNDRVLRYDGASPLTNGASAVGVLGQLNFANYAPNLVDAIGLASAADGVLFSAISPAVLGAPPTAAAIEAAAVIAPVSSAPPLPAGGLNALSSVAIDAANHLYLSDSTNNRVLGWHSAAAYANGAAADLVIGEPDFNTSSCNQGSTAPTKQTLCEPMGIATDSNNNLFVADLGNSRIVEYNPPFLPTPLVQYPAAVRVFGQAGSFTTHACDAGGVSPTALCQPISVALDGLNDLFVADFHDSRILEYTSPFGAATAANMVIGQPNFTAAACNDGTNGGDSMGLGTDSLCDPVGLIFDQSDNLYAADAGNSRVVEYLAPSAAPNPSCVPAADGSGCAGDAFADLVLGQANFTGNSCLLTFQGLCFPTAVAIDKVGNAFVADAANNRVAEFDVPLANGQSENLLFGQPAGNFTAGFCDSMQSGGLQTGIYATAEDLCNPLSEAFDAAGNLYVSDAGNNRMLEFLPPFAAAQNGGQVVASNSAVNGTPGSTVAGGSFTVSNQTSTTEYVTSANVSFGTPTEFTSATLSATTGQTASPITLTATTTFNFGAPVQIPSNSSMTFTLSAVISGSATTPSSSTQSIAAVTASAPAAPVIYTGLPAQMSTVSITGSGGAVSLVTSGTLNATPGASLPNIGTFSVTNNSSSALSVGSVQISLSDAAEFSSATLAGGGGSAGGAPLGATTTFTFSTPVAIGVGSSVNFTLSGAAAAKAAPNTNSIQAVTSIVAGQATFTGLPLTLGTVTIVSPPGKLGAPLSVGFGLHKIGVPSPAKTVTLRAGMLNKGTITISAVTLNNGANPSGTFAIESGSDLCTGATLAARKFCTVKLIFTAAAKGRQFGTLTITDDAIKNPQTIKLVGGGH